MSSLPDNQLERLLERLREASARDEKCAKATCARFNLFTTLLKNDDEVRLHTRFIHCLLNPQGLHDCGDLFLKLFLQTLRELPPVDHDDHNFQMKPIQTDASWEVEKEFSITEVGQIDILLRRINSREFGIAIENKPGLDQHEDQLKRYADWLKQFDEWHLFYLTLHGGQSATHHGREYLRISYKEHILTWLEKCLKETNDRIPINQALLQYRAVVRELTGKNIKPETMKEMIQFIAGHPDIIRFRSHIVSGIDQIRKDLLKRLASDIKKDLAEIGIKVKPCDPNIDRFEEHGDRLTLTPPSQGELSALAGAPFKIFLEYDGSVVVGVVTQEHYINCSRNKELSTSPPPAELFEKMRGQIEQKFHGVFRWQDNCKGIWPTGWISVLDLTNDEALAELVKKDFNITASEVCGAIKEYLKHLERAYIEASKQGALEYNNNTRNTEPSKL